MDRQRNILNSKDAVWVCKYIVNPFHMMPNFVADTMLEINVQTLDKLWHARDWSVSAQVYTVPHAQLHDGVFFVLLLEGGMCILELPSQFSMEGNEVYLTTRPIDLPYHLLVI